MADVGFISSVDLGQHIQDVVGSEKMTQIYCPRSLLVIFLLKFWVIKTNIKGKLKVESIFLYITSTWLERLHLVDQNRQLSSDVNADFWSSICNVLLYILNCF